MSLRLFNVILPSPRSQQGIDVPRRTKADVQHRLDYANITRDGAVIVSSNYDELVIPKRTNANQDMQLTLCHARPAARFTSMCESSISGLSNARKIEGPRYWERSRRHELGENWSELMSKQSVFDKYGGFSKVSRVVLTFYDTLLDSDEIGPFFDDIDMSKMVDHQTKFIASVLGGPASYTDKQLHNLHVHLDITDAHFDELKVVLADALRNHGFETGDIDAVSQEFEKRRALIVRASDVD